MDRSYSDLPANARQILAELELCSHGSTQAFNPSGGHNAEKTALLPPGDSNPPHLTWRRRMLQATDAQLPGVIAGARSELETLRGYGRAGSDRPKDETLDQRNHRIVSLGGQGWSARDVANHVRCGVGDVTKAWTDAGLDPTTGREIPKHADLIAEAKRMRERGASLRQIELVTGLKRSTLHRALDAAA